MKYVAALALLSTLALAQATAPRTVYIFPMAGGLDQYLAQSLTRDHVMQVVADPKVAETVMTDRLGDAFEQKLSDIHAADEKKAEGSTRNAFHSSRPRGTVFLVDAKSRNVLWSDYQKTPRSYSEASLNRQAERIAKKLQGR